MVMHVSGESAGGIYVALAAGVDTVHASSQAVLRVLPVAAVNTVLRRSLPDETLQHALDAGVVDRIIHAQENAASEHDQTASSGISNG